MVMFGSLTHLAKRGLESYADECVKMKKVFTNMLPKSCIVTHVALLPLGGLVGAATVRDLYDLDSWLLGAGGGDASLPAARAELWRACLGDDVSILDEKTNLTRVHFMPESIHSSTKVRTLSGAPHAPLPAELRPMTEESERKIIFSLMKELNDTYAINVPEQPVLSRSSGSDSADLDIGTGRIFAIGGSHIKRLVGGLAGLSLEIIDLSKPGWKADLEPLAELSAKTKKYGLCDTDTVVIDMLSNSVICGTGTRGKPAEQFKSDSKWHVPGSLCFEPKSVLKAVLAEAKEKIFTGISPRLVCVGPLPRYILEKCCSDPGHIQNIEASDYISDMEQNIEIIDDLLVGWAQEINGRSDYLNFRMVADNPERFHYRISRSAASSSGLPATLCMAATATTPSWQQR
jgi:hypothetical protein